MSVKYEKPREILGQEVAGVNQIVPIHYPWAWEAYLTSLKNTWAPNDVSMARDVEQWKAKDLLTEDERLLVKRCLGFFAGSESLVANNLLLTIFRFVTSGDLRQQILVQAFQECLHNHTVVYCCDSLGLDIDEVYGAYRNIPSIKAKDDFLMSITSDITRPDFTTKTLEGKREFLRSLITYYLICEGTLFYSSFLCLLSMNRRNLLPGLATQIIYTIRDEGVHCQFGSQLINEIKAQYPKIWTKDFELETIEHFKKAIQLEDVFIEDILPNGILGLNHEMLGQYVRYLANLRLKDINVNFQFEDAKNSFSWLSELIELPKARNFFETTVTEYQRGNLVDDF